MRPARLYSKIQTSAASSERSPLGSHPSGSFQRVLALSRRDFAMRCATLILLGSCCPDFGGIADRAAADELPDRDFSARAAEEQLAERFGEMAVALAESGRKQAAEAVRRWLPSRRRDATIAFFSQLELEISDPSLGEPKVTAAFLSTRQTTSRRALQLAREAAAAGEADWAYRLLWRALREDPTSTTARRLLGLPAGNTARVSVRPGRTAPAVLGWAPRSFLVADSTHFRIYSAASRRETSDLAADLERFFEVWAQLFRSQWITDEQLSAAVSAGRPVAPPANRLQIALFGDRETYVRFLGRGNPNAVRSTGYYSPEHQLTLLFAGEQADAATRYHELTHQLLQEACGPVTPVPGEARGFWLVEGIANYMESLRFHDSFASVGGWEAERLQYARARWLGSGDPPDLHALADESRDEVLQRSDLGAWYSAAAAYTHLLMDRSDSRGALQRYLQSLYRGRVDDGPLRLGETDYRDMLLGFLRLDEQRQLPLHPGTQLGALCLGHTRVNRGAIQQLPPQPGLEWLDLAALPVTSTDVSGLLGGGRRLSRLNLEGTRVDDEIATLLGRQRDLEELDLSFTPIGDATLANLTDADELTTLWLTGTRVSDEAIPFLLRLQKLRELDVQQTAITSAGLQRLRAARPELRLNPLRLVAPQE
jgi:hypothetical protein